MAPTRGEVAESLKSFLGTLKVPGGPTAKYRNQPTVADGIQFASKKEAARYEELAAAARSGAISDLEIHPRFPLVIHEQSCGYYEPDFAYIDGEGRRRVEDVKSAPTREKAVYRLKRRLMWAIYALRVEEV